jgi:hypothetical protein
VGHVFRLLPVKAASLALLAATFGAAAIKPALAEFNIQEAEWQRGDIELEYRGASHWGVPGVTEANPNANDLRQSHELEFQWGIADWLLIQVTAGANQPLGENLNFSSIEIEGEVPIVHRTGDGVGLAFQGGYEQAINHTTVNDGQANEWDFGPIVEFAEGPVLLTLNPLFTKQVGEFADTQGPGFQYGWRGVYALNSHWGLGVEMFGEIEDLANAGSFNSQNHSLGPTLFYTVGGADDKDDDEKTRPGFKGSNVEQIPGSPEMELSLNIGVQIGLTDAASDAALKFQGSIQF